MPEKAPQRHAFVLRIWQEEGIPWRGWVQHAGTQEQAYIQSVPELVDFIQHHTQGLLGLAKEDMASSEFTPKGGQAAQGGEHKVRPPKRPSVFQHTNQGGTK